MHARRSRPQNRCKPADLVHYRPNGGRDLRVCTIGPPTVDGICGFAPTLRRGWAGFAGSHGRRAVGGRDQRVRTCGSRRSCGRAGTRRFWRSGESSLLPDASRVACSGPWRNSPPQQRRRAELKTKAQHGMAGVRPHRTPPEARRCVLLAFANMSEAVNVSRFQDSCSLFH